MGRGELMQRQDCGIGTEACRGTSLMRKRTPLGPYRTPMPRVLGGSLEGGRFRLGEVPL